MWSGIAQGGFMKSQQTSKVRRGGGIALLGLFLAFAAGCSLFRDTYHDEDMDFGALRVLAVMPLENVSRDRAAGARVRDVVVTKLLATYGFYVLPVGEVARSVAQVHVAHATAPSPREAIKLGADLEADGIITGTLREYGQIRSGTTSSNVISLSLQLIETDTGKVVWTASSTKGGVGILDRLFGGGGEPMNDVTGAAVDDLIGQLFQ